jgi:hypothetical protein
LNSEIAVNSSTVGGPGGVLSVTAVVAVRFVKRYVVKPDACVVGYSIAFETLW